MGCAGCPAGASTQMTHRTRGTGRAWASAAPGSAGGGRMPPPQRTPQPAHPPSEDSALSPSATKHPLAGGCGGLSTSKARRSGRWACAAQRRRRGLPPAAWSSLRRPAVPADPQRLRGLRKHRRFRPASAPAPHTRPPELGQNVSRRWMDMLAVRCAPSDLPGAGSRSTAPSRSAAGSPQAWPHDESRLGQAGP